ncbi:MAG: aminotransferase class I/II-fold pyridoxal phosphate-dependent enzyme [Candidatus Aenigmarchaeota archaeon]|nr:aminotransferase class I/II-fold pyridoxal phosphate-dependent enzyme [Candidatus Aenigmarchaeota archaeon]
MNTAYLQSIVQSTSAVREMFELGLKFKAEGKQPIDISLGNPTVKPPKEYFDAVQKIIGESKDCLLNMHNYMSNAGFLKTLERVAADLSARFGFKFTSNDIVMTAGAANALHVVLKTLIEPVVSYDTGTVRNGQDEVIVIAPYFVEYDHYIKNNQGKVVVVHADKNFDIDIAAIEQVISKNTTAIIINSPNNPTGVVYGEQELKSLAALFEKKQQEFNSTICIIEDSPYDLVVFESKFCSMLNYYRNTIYVTSFSKSLGIAGERIGFLAVHPDFGGGMLRKALIANLRTCVVNAPALQQRVLEVMGCNAVGAVEQYMHKVKRLVQVMQELNFKVAKPQGAFYIFAEIPPQFADELEFRKYAHEGSNPFLYTPGCAFGGLKYGRHIRLSACASDEVIEAAVSKLRAICQKIYRSGT